MSGGGGGEGGGEKEKRENEMEESASRYAVAGPAIRGRVRLCAERVTRVRKRPLRDVRDRGSVQESLPTAMLTPCRETNLFPRSWSSETVKIICGLNRIREIVVEEFGRMSKGVDIYIRFCRERKKREIRK